MLFLCIFVITVQSWAQQKMITGTVTDENAQPLPGVSVIIKGTTNGTSTNEDGKYSIQADQSQVLIFSFIGTASQEVNIGNKNLIDIKLFSDEEVLDEVIIVGYGTQKKSNLTGAVSTVDVGKTIGNRPVTDIGRGIQGIAAGLTVTTQSGELGKNPHITLRGLKGSLNSGSAQPLILLDNVEIQDLMMVNPEDIESISILKDAASASIYGTRAAWGVILITSKTGKKDQAPQITYTNNFSWSQPLDVPKIAPGPEGAEMALAARRRRIPNTTRYTILGASYDDISIERMREWKELYGGQDLGNEMVLDRDFEVRNGRLFFYRPWDVEDLYLNKYSPQQKHDINVRGGSDKTTYNLGLGYLGKDGVLKVNPDKYDRYSISMSVNSDVTSWFEVRGKMMFSNTVKTNPFFRLNPPISPWFNIYRYPETFPYGTYEGQPFRNLITEVEQANLERTESNLTRIQIGGLLNVLPGLTVDGDYTFSSSNRHFNTSGHPLSGINHWTNKLTVQDNFLPAAFDRTIYTSSWNSIHTGKFYATYIKNIKDHAFKVIAGGDIEYFEAYSQTSQRNGLLDPDMPEISLATGDQFVGGGHSHWSTQGFFGRINYSFKDKFLLEINSRFDGSSKFPTSKQWGFFPSQSFGYVISKEPFMDFLNPVLSFLKIRESYGSIGNQNVGAYRFLSIVSASNSNWWIGGNNMRTVSTPAPLSPSLTWEKVSTLDFGLDARILNDRMGVTFDWYKRTTSDMITAGVTLPNTFGASAPVRNYGEMQTTGWELTLTWAKTFNNGLRIDLLGMVSDFQEEITKFANTTMNIGGNYEGKVLGEIWGYETDRFFNEGDFSGQDGSGNWIPNSDIPDQSLLKGNVGWFNWGPGDIKFKDLNGDGKVDYGSNTLSDHGDLKVIGNSTPRYQYGFRFNADYKSFDFSAFVQGVGKRQLWPSGAQFIPGMQWNEAWYAHQTDYWTPENQDAYYPRPTDQVGNNHALNFNIQTKYLLNMAYMRMKNITVGYTIPRRVTNKLKINKARIYVSGENLFSLDKVKIPIDPEIDYTDEQPDHRSFNKVYPYTRNYSFGLQITL